MMLLHAGETIAPHDFWSAWSFEPGVVLLLGASIGLYVAGSRRLSRLSKTNARRARQESFFFVAGIVTLAVALVSPLHELGETLFSAHMVQHELLMAIAAPLLVLGRPGVPMLWAFPQRARHSIGAALASGSFRSGWSAISNPLSAWILHALAIWVWHAPSLYDASVRSELVHTAQHMSFMLTALLFWWSVLSPRALRHGAGIGVISLFTTGVHTTLLGALLTVASDPLYSAYTAAGTNAWGLSRLADQQLGGIVMWVPAGVVYMVVALFLFRTWMRESEKRVVRTESIRRANAARVIGQTAALAMFIALLSSCAGGMDDQEAAELTGGNPHRGALAIRRYGCPACHTIKGISGANGLVGPPLTGIASRSYIAGVLVNSPDNLVTWIQNPPHVDNKTVMPNMGVTDKDARDIAAYLYTLR